MCILMAPVGDQNLGDFLETAIHGRNFETTVTHSVLMKTWFSCLASALAYIHLQRIRHEDIKPSNVICRGKDILFTDFGSSREYSQDRTWTENPALASRLFAATEAVVDDDGNLSDHGSQTDIFSLGLIFMEMLWALNETAPTVTLRNYISGWSGNPVTQYCKVLNYLAQLPKSAEQEIIYTSFVEPMLASERVTRPRAHQLPGLIRKARLKQLKCLCQGGLALTQPA
jgi:serine/threonine protein kinase